MAVYSIHRQRGASMVEMTIVILLFLTLIFAIFEFALAIFYASRLSEATRAGARYAIVTNPSLSGISEMSCSELDASGFSQCDAASCSEIVEQMSKVVSVNPANVYIRYQCSQTGFSGAAGYSEANQEVYSVTVKLQGVQYALIMPGVLGLDAYLSMPSFETTRLSEDLWSPEE